MTALLTELHETGAPQGLDHALPERLSSLGMSAGNFDGSPELGSFSGPAVRSTPSFEIELDGLAQIGMGGFDVFPLRSDAKLGTARDIPIVFFGAEGREAIVHTAMLTKATGRGKGLQQDCQFSIVRHNAKG